MGNGKKSGKHKRPTPVTTKSKVTAQPGTVAYLVQSKGLKPGEAIIITSR